MRYINLNKTSLFSLITKAKNKQFTESDIGTEFVIPLGGVDYTWRIIGVNHDDLADGSGKANVTLQMVNLYNEYKRMNSSNTNEGGWEATEMRNTTLPSIFNQLPVALQQFIKTVKKPYVTTYNGSTIAYANDKLFLLSSAEMGSNYSYKPKVDEGTVYSYWSSHNTDDDRRKGKQSNPTDYYYWWLRSPSSYNGSYFCYVSSDGGWSNGYASYTRGVAPAFCL